jgi:hypothetical protein
MTPVPAPGDNLNGGQDTRLDVHSQKKAMRLQKQKSDQKYFCLG